MQEESSRRWNLFLKSYVCFSPLVEACGRFGEGFVCERVVEGIVRFL